MNGHDYNSFDSNFYHPFGHPYSTAAPQVTEDFWHQTPEVSDFTYKYYDSIIGVFFYFDPASSTDNMDTKVVKIGSATNHLSKRAAAPVKEYVDVYIGDQLVKTVPLRQLTRFSKAASRTFPAPKLTEETITHAEGHISGTEGKNQDAKSKTQATERKYQDTKAKTRATEGMNKDAKQKTENAEAKTKDAENGLQDAEEKTKDVDNGTKSEAEGVESCGDVKALAADGGALTTSSELADLEAKPEKSATPPKATASKIEVVSESKRKPTNPSDRKNSNREVVFEPKHQPKQQPNRIFRVELADVPNCPTARAVMQSLTWMEMNSGVHNSMTLLPFYVPDESKGYPIAAYIDIYAAALAFDLRPFPVNLRQTIFNIITIYRPRTADVICIAERVPLDDSVVKRMITSCYEHESEYEGSEWDDLLAYSEVNQPLNQRFMDVEKARRRFQSKQSRQQMQAEAILRQKHVWGMRGDATEHHDLNNGNDHGKGRGGKGSGKTRQAGKSSAQTTVPKSPTVMEIGLEGETSSGGQTDGGEKANGGGKKKERNGKGVGGKHIPGV
ncbi:hypothetical protein LTR91_007787 [Friedmanniomyces endolithicus]|uniref:Uncharacterized protein n=1 Tax=Friedmanniomyces endolithicus TaxID=329885 RepID=A0AAN6QUR1_9PEZI|nr:hypothetical protein LTR35_008643 [Friedmanniomyces endolithicus]KAK0287920.1 hypothetical protein LTS00_009765 [Friedmanniomyces endolithicus]KAK0320833.1 hypothetical protein LTR82_008151 [Friedmanniomyces endolithicus]KAK0903698.1 hypothetical protein LTR57_019062 [Friedmanniomyces endolithicus]KAK0994016.1 hypothetical protein LTR91_007787 [Friedmanniomyces endolithicus]